MKYIIIRRPDGTEHVYGCMCPDTHAELATAHRRNDASVVVAAGFCEFITANGRTIVQTFGRSESLNLGRRSEDAKLIEVSYNLTVESGWRDEMARSGV
jgi:hypothetical protein